MAGEDELYVVGVQFQFTGSVDAKKARQAVDDIADAAVRAGNRAASMGRQTRQSAKDAAKDLRELRDIIVKVTEVQAIQARQATLQANARAREAKAAVAAAEQEAKAAAIAERARTRRTVAEQAGLTERTSVNAAARVGVARLQASTDALKRYTEIFQAQVAATIEAERNAVRSEVTRVRERVSTQGRLNQMDRLKIVQIQQVEQAKKHAFELDRIDKRREANAELHQQRMTQIAERGAQQQARLDAAALARADASDRLAQRIEARKREDARRRSRDRMNNDERSRLQTERLDAAAEASAERARLQAERIEARRRQDARTRSRDRMNLSGRSDLIDQRAAARSAEDARRLARDTQIQLLRIQQAGVTAQSRLDVVRTQQETTAARSRNRIIVGLQSALFNELHTITRAGSNAMNTILGAGVRGLSNTWDTFLSRFRGGFRQSLQANETAAIQSEGRLRSTLSRLSPTAIVGAIGGGAAGKSALDAFKEYELLQVSLNRMIGDPGQTEKLLGDLKTFAKKTPFEIGDVEQLARGFLVIDKDVSKLVPTLETVADAVAFTGGTGVQLDRVRLALSQIKSAGKLQGDELNQLGEALPGIALREIIAGQLGISVAELVQRQQAGDLSADEFLPAFFTGLRQVQGLSSTASASVETLSGKLSNLKDSFTINAREIVGKLAPAIKVGLDAVSSVVERTFAFGSDLITNTSNLFKLYRFRISEQIALIGSDPAIRHAIDSVKFGLASIRDAFNAENSGAQRSLIVAVWERIPGIFERIRKVAVLVAPTVESIGDGLTNLAGEINQRGLAAVRDRLVDVAKVVAPGAGLVTGMLLLRGAFQSIAKGNLVQAGLLAAAGGLVTLYRTNETFREGVDQTIGRVRELGSTFVDAFAGKAISGDGFFDQLTVGAGRFAREGVNAVKVVGAGLSGLFSGEIAVDGLVAKVRTGLTNGLDAVLAPIRTRVSNFFSDIDPVSVLDGIRKLFAPIGRVLGEFLGSKEFLGIVAGITAAAGSAVVGFVQGFAEGLARSDLAGIIVAAVGAAIRAIPGLLADAFRESFSNGPFVAIGATILAGLGLSKIIAAVTTATQTVGSRVRTMANVVTSAGASAGLGIANVGISVEKLGQRLIRAGIDRGSGQLVQLGISAERMAPRVGRVADYVADNFGKLATTFVTANIAFSTLFSDATPGEKIMALSTLVIPVLITAMQEVQAAGAVTAASLSAAFAPLAVVAGISALIAWLSSAGDESEKTADSVKRLGDLYRSTRAEFIRSLETGGVEQLRLDFYDSFKDKVTEGNKELTSLTKQTQRYGYSVRDTAKALVGGGAQYAALAGKVKRYRDEVGAALNAQGALYKEMLVPRQPDAIDNLIENYITSLRGLRDEVPGVGAAITQLEESLRSGVNATDGSYRGVLDVIEQMSPKLQDQLGVTEETLETLRSQRQAYRNALTEMETSVDFAQERASAEAKVKGEVEKTADSYNLQKQRIMEIKDLLTGGTKNPFSNFVESQRELVTTTDSAASQVKEILANSGSVGDLLANQFSVAGARFNDLLASLGDSAASTLTAAASTYGSDPAAFMAVADGVRKNFVAALTAGGVGEQDANQIADAVFGPLIAKLANPNGPLGAAGIAAQQRLADYFAANPLNVNIDLDTLQAVDEADIAIENWLAKPTDPKTIQSFLSIEGAAEILERFIANPDPVRLRTELQDLAVRESELKQFTAPRSLEIGVDIVPKSSPGVAFRNLDRQEGRNLAKSAASITGPIVKELNEVPARARDSVSKTTSEMGRLPAGVQGATGPGMKRWSEDVKSRIDETGKAFEAAPTRAEAQLRLMDRKLRPSTDSIRAQFDGITESINNVVRATGGQPIVPQVGAKNGPLRKEIFHTGGIVGQGIERPVSQLAPNERLVLTQLDEGIIPSSTMAKMSRTEFEWIRTGQLDRLVSSRAAIPGTVAALRQRTLPPTVGIGDGLLLPLAAGLGRMVTRAVDFLETAGRIITGRLQRETGGYDPTAKVAGPVQATEWIRTAMAIAGAPASWFVGLMTIARRESNFNPRAINLWDSNAAKGIPSKGLMQTIEPTFRRWALPGYLDIWNPVHNAIAAIRYIKARYGDISRVQQANPAAAPKGYAQGDIVNRPTLGVFGEAGPEVILPLSKPKRFFELLGAAMAHMGLPAFADGAIFTAPEQLDIGAKVYDLKRERDARRGPQVVDNRQYHSHTHVHTNVVDPRSALIYADANDETKRRRYLG